jgi:hypothetical protein
MTKKVVVEMTIVDGETVCAHETFADYRARTSMMVASFGFSLSGPMCA